MVSGLSVDAECAYIEKFIIEEVVQRMANYLILCSDYLSPADANGICIKNIAQELTNRGGTVFIVSESDKRGLISERDNICVYGVKRTWFTRFLKRNGESGLLPKLVRLLRACFTMPLYPNVSPVRSYEVYHVARRLVKQHDITTVVCAYRPFESLWAGMKLKNVFPPLRVIGYHLDLLMAANNTSAFIKKYKHERAASFFEREKNKLDKVILPKSALNKNYRGNNISYADFPLFSIGNKGKCCGFSYENGYINFSYIGSIDGSNREITYLAQVLERVQEKTGRPIRLNIWGNIAEGVQEQISDNSMIQYHGLVDNDFTFDLLYRADFVVNLSNKNTPEMVPSKIFQLFSVRTPILNVVEAENDASLPYFQRNEFACNVCAYESNISDAIVQVADFTMAYCGKKQNLDLVEKLYGESNPAYVADLVG